MSTQAIVHVPRPATIKEHPKGILVDGLPLVRALLMKFMSGVSKHSRASARNLPAAMAALLRVIQEGQEVPFLKNLFEEMNEGLHRNGRFRKNYEYDGQGPFLKTTVEVLDLAGELYVPEGYADPFLLTLYTAAVGSKVEDGLADAVGIEQGLLWSSVELNLPAHGPYASVDLATIIDPLRPVLGLWQPKTERYARRMMPRNNYDTLGPANLKLVDEEIMVRVGIDSHSFLPSYRHTENKLTRNGSVISGRRSENLDTNSEDEFAPLRVKVSVVSSNQRLDHEFDPMPVLRSDKKKTMRDLTRTIASALQN